MTDAPIFILGSASSGTTLLSVLLDRHPAIACGPEVYVFNKHQVYGDYARFKANLPRWLDEGLVCDGQIDTPDFFFNREAYFTDRAALIELSRSCNSLREFFDQFYARYLARRGKRRWADKSGSNAYYLHRILELYPGARMVHMARDGRDVMCSMLGRDPGQHVHAASHWLYNNAAAMRWESHPGYLRVRYEDLAAEPEQVLRRVCDHIGEPFDPVMLDAGNDAYWRRQAEVNTHGSWNATPVGAAVTAKSVGRYRDELPAHLQSLFWHTRLTGVGRRRLGVSFGGAAELMVRLGYEDSVPDGVTRPRGGAYVEAAGTYLRRARVHWRRERRPWQPLTHVSPMRPGAEANIPSSRATQVAGRVGGAAWRVTRAVFERIRATQSAANDMSPPVSTIRPHLAAIARELRWHWHYHRSARRVSRFTSKPGPLKLELGAGTVHRPGWVTIDVNPSADLFLDLRRPLPFPDASVDEIHSEHVFEHLRYPDELAPLLAECRRVLKPAGVISFSVPNMRPYMRAYVRGDESFLRHRVSDTPDSGAFDGCAMDLFNWMALRQGEHQVMFDDQNAQLRLCEAGFEHVRVRPFDPARDYDERPSSVYVEGVKDPPIVLRCAA